MKAFKIELKELDFADETGGAGNAPRGRIRYGDLVKAVIGSPSGERGLSTDEMMQAVAFWNKVDDATAEEKPLLLTADEHKHFLAKLATFQWAFTSRAVAAFIADVRAAPEVSLAVAT